MTATAPKAGKAEREPPTVAVKRKSAITTMRATPATTRASSTLAPMM